jgi:hypothetical protein
MHGLSAIAERLSGMGIGEEVEEYEEEHEHGNSGSEGEGEEEDEQRMKEQDRQAREQGQKGMDDERVLKSGYLYKKQEKRKVRFSIVQRCLAMMGGACQRIES